MAGDLNDAWGWIERLVRRVDRLYSGAMLENSSITNGRMRFIGGVLRVDSGGTVSIEGTLEVDGATTITGSFLLEGPWEISGDGSITGKLTITGPVSITGDVTAIGKWIQTGEWELNGNGKIKGNVEQTGQYQVKAGGRIIVGEGAAQIVIDGSSGKITAGNLTIDPSSNGGSVKFASGPEVYANGPELSLYSGGAWITLTDGLAKISSGGLTWMEITPAGFKLVGLPTKVQSSVPGSVPGMVWADSSGNVFRIVP